MFGKPLANSIGGTITINLMIGYWKDLNPACRNLFSHFSMTGHEGVFERCIYSIH